MKKTFKDVSFSSVTFYLDLDFQGKKNAEDYMEMEFYSEQLGNPYYKRAISVETLIERLIKRSALIKELRKHIKKVYIEFADETGDDYRYYFDFITKTATLYEPVPLIKIKK